MRGLAIILFVSLSLLCSQVALAQKQWCPWEGFCKSKSGHDPEFDRKLKEHNQKIQQWWKTIPGGGHLDCRKSIKELQENQAIARKKLPQLLSKFKGNEREHVKKFMENYLNDDIAAACNGDDDGI